MSTRALTHVVALAALFCASFAGPVMAQQPSEPFDENTALRRTKPYSDEFVETMRGLPVLERGRIMPFATYAKYLLLRVNNRSSFKIADDAESKRLYGELAGTELSATEWATDLLFFPSQALTYEVIEVTDRDVFTLFGMDSIAKRKRDRYSFEDLRPGFQKLEELAERVEGIEVKKRKRLQQQAYDLFRDVRELANVSFAFQIARDRIGFGTDEAFTAMFPEGTVRTAELIARLGEADRSKLGPDAIRGIQFAIEIARSSEAGWFWIPSADRSAEQWLSPRELLSAQLNGTPIEQADLQHLLRLQAAANAASTGDVAAFESKTTEWVEGIVTAAEKRDEYSKVPLEIALLDYDWFYRALLLFGFALIPVILGWLTPKARWLHRISFGLVSVGALLAIAGITHRCILRERPPITNLYETILFIAATGVVVLLVIEWIQKKRVALSLGAVFGFLGMLSAMKFEYLKGQDTMLKLQAVLDTNYWLAIHVTTINLGYMAMLVAGFFGHVYLGQKLVGGVRRLQGKEDVKYSSYRSVGRMLYGALALGVITSTVGTILGGIWAADSWGRFWGWDPKENGALLIVLCGLIMLHARMAGIARDFALSWMAVLTNCVVIYSWFGVNLKAVGLHSYGFESGMQALVDTIYLSELAFAVVVSIAAYVLHKMADDRSAPETAPPVDSRIRENEAGEAPPLPGSGL